MAKNATITDATNVLAVNRSINCSDGLMYATNWADRFQLDTWEPVKVTKKALRGTISNRQKAAVEKDEAKLNQEINKPNIQEVESASLPSDKDTLVLTFTVRVDGGPTLDRLSACDNAEYEARYREVMNEYLETHGDFSVLAERYAQNLLNGRPGFRNNFGAQGVETHVEEIFRHETREVGVVDSQSLSPRDFSKGADDEVVKTLTNRINHAMTEDLPVMLRVTIAFNVGLGMEVYPSQEMNVGGGKVLFKVGDDQAALHTQKIGNAIRTVDTWYPGADQTGYAPIAAEPYGAVTNRGQAYRPGRSSFYALHDSWFDKGKAPEPEQQHYVMSVLIRGGVFGKSSK